VLLLRIVLLLQSLEDASGAVKRCPPRSGISSVLSCGRMRQPCGRLRIAGVRGSPRTAAYTHKTVGYKTYARCISTLKIQTAQPHHTWITTPVYQQFSTSYTNHQNHYQVEWCSLNALKDQHDTELINNYQHAQISKLSMSKHPQLIPHHPNLQGNLTISIVTTKLEHMTYLIYSTNWITNQHCSLTRLVTNSITFILL
jgi:hypothetical protein